MKILLVEDSWILRDRLRDIISAIPQAILAAESCNEDDAKAQLDQHRPDVAVIDLQLRGGSGLSLIAHARVAHAATMIIVLTNLAQPEYRARCMELGAHYFFDKSKDIDAFIYLLTDMGKREAGLPDVCRIDTP